MAISQAENKENQAPRYITNLSDVHEVQMVDSTLKIPPLGWIEVTAEETQHMDITQSIRKNWIKVSETKPTEEASPEVLGVKIETAKVVGTLVPPKREKNKSTTPAAKETRLGGGTGPADAGASNEG